MICRPGPRCPRLLCLPLLMKLGARLERRALVRLEMAQKPWWAGSGWKIAIGAIALYSCPLRSFAAQALAWCTVLVVLLTLQSKPNGYRAWRAEADVLLTLEF